MLPIALALTATSPCAPDLGGFQEISAAVPAASLVARGDINGDGLQDLVCASSDTRSISWFPGTVDGPAQEVRVAGFVAGPIRGLAAGDVDGDGYADIVVIHRNGREASWLRNDGRGGFALTTLATNQWDLGTEIYIVDFDQDGDREVILMRANGSPGSQGPLLFDNLGAGVLAAPGPLLDLAGPYSDMALFDVDGDGLRDATLCDAHGNITWHKNPGGAGPWVRSSIESQPFFRSNHLKAVDLDGDGDRDLAMAATGFAEFRLYENLGGGAFGARIDLGTNTHSFADLEPIDMDADGDLDLVATTGSDMGLRWLENVGGLQFVDRGPFLLSGGVNARDLDLADVNGDGFDDVLLVGEEIGTGRRTVEWVAGVSGSATGMVLDDAAQSPQRPIPLASASAIIDANRDGVPDVVTASPDGGVFLSPGLGGDRFAAPGPILPSIQAADSVQAADLNQDGTEDLLVGTPTGEVWWVAIDAAGSMGSPQFVGTALPPHAVAPDAIDFDGDGDLDIVLAAHLSADLLVVEQLSSGAFAASRPLLSGTAEVRDLLAADFDLDGTLDLLAAEQGTTGLRFELHRGLGSGAFAAPVTALTTQQQRVIGLTTTDLNGDGLADLTWVDPAQRQIQRALNAGAGTFHAPEDLGTFTHQAEAACLGPAGPSDEVTLVVFHRGIQRILGTLEWFAIQGPTAVSLQRVEVRLDEVAHLGRGDVNGDGDIDLLVSAPTQGRVGWFENTTIQELGSKECSPAVPNSLGLPAHLRVIGAGASPSDEVTLQGLTLPAGATTLFLASRQPDLVVGPGGSLGNLCLGGSIGRFAGPGQITTASAAGVASLVIDMHTLPQPTGPISAITGETWRFQAWYRDPVIGGAVSNFTDAVAILIQ